MGPRSSTSPLFHQGLKAAALFLCTLSWTVACGPKSQPKAPQGSPPCTKKEPNLLPYCSNNPTYSPSYTVSGTAQFQARSFIDGVGLGPASSPQAIRYAEVRILDSAGKTVQCGETNELGAYSLNVPAVPGEYTVAVYSRGINSHVRAQVLTHPSERLKQLHVLSTSVSVTSGSVTAPPLLAGVDGEVPGGAFNILEQIVKATDFVVNDLGTPSPPKVDVYWQKGVDPGTYFDTGPISFYLQGYSCLFILGGENGDVNTSDTDHFDNSIIIHEFGHFLEDTVFRSDSPGGPHSGTRQIDPRLAWSEAWGNFFQAAVLNSPRYIDTAGNVTGTPTLIFDIPLEDDSVICANPPTGVGPYGPGCDAPLMDGEGNFREFSITRFLWDAFDESGGSLNNDSDGDGIDFGFPEAWGHLISGTGFLNSAVAFRSVGLLDLIQIRGPPGSNWSSLYSMHKHDTELKEYARYVTRSGACGSNNYSMEPFDDPQDNGSFGGSNLLRNNDFFHYKHPGGPLRLRLNYTTLPCSTPPCTLQEPDLDLYLYQEDYIYGDSDSMLGNSQTYFDNQATTPEIEAINISNAPAGNYMINVKAYTGQYTDPGCLGNICKGMLIPAGDPVSYELLVNEVRLCDGGAPL